MSLVSSTKRTSFQDFAMSLTRPLFRLCPLAGAVALLAALIVSTPSARVEAQSSDPAVAFMQRVAKDLIGAAKANSPDRFKDAILKHGHYRDIAHFALGDYKPKLTSQDRQAYYDGMVRFISRYAAQESQKYQVANAEIFGPATRTSEGIFVDSRVHLQDGSVYDVRWKLIPRGNSFLVRDAQVLMLWMTPYLRDLFVNYIAQNGGRVQNLVLALNQ